MTMLKAKAAIAIAAWDDEVAECNFRGAAMDRTHLMKVALAAAMGMPHPATGRPAQLRKDEETITSPTAPGRHYVTRAVDILVEKGMGAPIVAGMGEDDVELITLTNRMTGNSITLQSEMLDYIMKEISSASKP